MSIRDDIRNLEGRLSAIEVEIKQAAETMAVVLLRPGLLRNHVNYCTLRDLKHALRNFDARKRQWKS